jgi:Bacterial protein of unknown function (HtrL_YibB)
MAVSKISASSQRWLGLIALLCVYLVASNSRAFRARRRERDAFEAARFRDIGIPRSSNLTTIITTYFALGNRSKHPEANYDLWMQNFLRITSPIIVYSTQESVPLILRYREERPIMIKVLEDVWELPCGRFRHDYEGYQFTVDPENHIHYPELYVIWNSKTALVAEVAKENPFHSQYFIWADIGSFRDNRSRALGQWPLESTVKELILTDPDRVLVGVVDDNSTSTYAMEQGPLAADFVQGGFFGGTARAVRWFHRAFQKWHDIYLAKGFFVGKDQRIFNALVLSFPRHFLALEAFRFPYEVCGSAWFYFQPFFTDGDSFYPGCPRALPPPFEARSWLRRCRQLYDRAC